MEGAVDKLALSGGDVEVALRRPVFQRVGVFTYNPFAGARGVKQDGIEGFGQGRAKNPAVEVGQSDVADAAAADVSMQHLHPAGGEFIGENAARVAHSGCNLGGFRSRGGGNVHHPFGLPVIGEQGGDRQHRTGFLNIEQSAEMFGGTAQRQRVVILSLDPESLCAPGHRRELPAVGGNQREEIIDANLQRIDANTAA